MRGFLIGFSAVVGLLLLASMALPKGEIVTLHTADADGRIHESALWVVELEGEDGTLFLRSGNPASGWLARLTLHPLVELERGSETLHFRAMRSEDPATLRAVNAAMSEKYGAADRFVRSRVDVERAVAVRLEPIEGAGGPAFH